MLIIIILYDVRYRNNSLTSYNQSKQDKNPSPCMHVDIHIVQKEKKTRQSFMNTASQKTKFFAY
jgi:hypothetical protein